MLLIAAECCRSLLAMSLTRFVTFRAGAHLFVLFFAHVLMMFFAVSLLDDDGKIHVVMPDAAVLVADNKVSTWLHRFQFESRHHLRHDDGVVAGLAHLNGKGMNHILG